MPWHIKKQFIGRWSIHTVDGRNPAALIGSVSRCWQGFIHPRWCTISSVHSYCGSNTLWNVSGLLLVCTEGPFLQHLLLWGWHRWIWKTHYFSMNSIYIQEISNRTHWTDPQMWVSSSSSNLLRGSLVRSHSILTEYIWRMNNLMLNEKTYSCWPYFCSLGKILPTKKKNSQTKNAERMT